MRLDYLYDTVDLFVIVESLDSHSKKVRKDKYVFEENIELYRPYMDKIRYYKLDNLPFPGDSGAEWPNENYQKNYCAEGIKDLPDDAWILFSDVDEIPNKYVLRTLDSYSGMPLRFAQKLFYYHVNVLQTQIWDGTVTLQKRYFTSMMELRNNRSNSGVYQFPNGGWHYSYMGGAEKIYQKMQSYSESNANSQFCNLDNIKQSMETSCDILGRTESMFIKSVIDINEPDMAPDNIHKIINLYPYLLKNIIQNQDPAISFVCLIYKSTGWLQFVYEQIKKFTDLGSNEFFFVANDANQAVLDYLSVNNIPHYVHNNTEEQRKEWYINNVYRAYNYGGKMAKGKYIIFLNSDMAFTPGWSDRLVESITDTTCVASRLVERGALRSGTYGIEKNFGDNYNNYRENDLIAYANSIRENNLYDGGLYMPLLIKKEHLEKVGYYPEGNIVPGSDMFNPIYAKLGEPCIPGDITFIAKLESIGIKHKTNFNSIIYHFQQGEMSEVIAVVPPQELPLQQLPSQQLPQEVHVPTVGWLINDTLTCIPGTKTLWHMLLDSINGLVDKTGGYTQFDVLANNIEQQLITEGKPKYIIRNASYFRRINTDVYTIVLLQDNLRNSPYLFGQQVDVIVNANMVVVNSQSLYNEYKEYIPGPYIILSLGVDFDIFKPLQLQLQLHPEVLPNSILFIGASTVYPKGFDRLERLMQQLPDQNFCLIMKDDYSENQLPPGCQNRVKIFNSIQEHEITLIINSCLMGICTSYVETQHLAGVEICACNKPMVATNVGFYIDNADTEEWGVIADDTNFVEKINYVLHNLDKFNPRECLIKRGFTQETCKNKWINLVKNIP